jgi:glycosyltransferase involved in cell wall biosynthesis
MSHSVAIAFHEFILGGASRSIMRIMPLLEADGWRFACWTPGPGPLREALQASGHEVAGTRRLLRYRWRTLQQPPGPAARLASVPGYLREFRAWLAACDAAVLHANTLLTIPEAIAAGPSRPRLLYVHETVPPGPKGVVTAGLVRLAADVVVGISHAAAGGLRRWGVQPLVVPNGVPMPEPRAGERHEENCGRPLVIGTLGTISKRKGSDVFVAAAPRLRSELPTAELRMIGARVEGPDRPWAERVLAAATRAGIRHGERPEPYAELSEWDIAVVPSRDEPFGLVAAEAMAMGVPVVATRVGGLPEVVGTRAGALVEPDDPGGLAAAILELARDPRRRAACGEAGRARVRQNFTLEQQADGLIRAYRAALPQR